MKEREIFYTIQSDFSSTGEDVDEYEWNKDEDLCRDYLLNSLNPHLALTFHTYKTAKEIWDPLNAYFQKEEVLSKSLIGEKLFNFRLKANLSVTNQIIELQSKRHRRKEITLDDLKRFIHIEDQNIVGKSAEQVAQPSQAANFISRPSKPSRKPWVPKGDTPVSLAVKKPFIKRKNGKYHNCDKWGSLGC